MCVYGGTNEECEGRSQTSKATSAGASDGANLPFPKILHKYFV